MSRGTAPLLRRAGGVMAPLCYRAVKGPKVEDEKMKYRTWDFMSLKRVLLEEDQRTRPIRERISKNLRQSRGWKANHLPVVKDFGPFDGAKVLKHLREREVA